MGCAVKDAEKIALPTDASKDTLRFLRQLRDIIAELQCEVDALKKEVARK
jgi:hypothetical protein